MAHIEVEVTEVVGEALPGTALAILSGPSFARDVAQGLVVSGHESRTSGIHSG